MLFLLSLSLIQELYLVAIFELVLIIILLNKNMKFIILGIMILILNGKCYAYLIL